MTNNLTQKSSLITFVILASLVVYIATRMLLSSVYSLQGNLFLEDWQQKQTSPTQEAWQAALSANQKAQNHYPIADAFLQEKMGKTLQWQTFNKLPNDKSALSNRLAALTAYRQQTQLTPNWPKAWFNLLSIKIELNQFDQEFYQAFNIAKQTTQQTPGMLTQYTIVGIQAYQYVNKQTKNEILKNIITEATSNKRNSQNIQPLLQAYNLLGITCVYARAIKTNTYNLCK